jgi:hypothetical protein
MLDGQATDHLRIKTSHEDAQKFISATVSVRGMPEGCPNSASDSWGVAYRSNDEILDQYGRIPWSKEQARLDNFHFQIEQNPESTGLIYMQIRSADSIDEAKKHARKIAEHFGSCHKHFDLLRLMIRIDRVAESPTTSFTIIPRGSKVRVCSPSCILLNGKDL